jgi:hypothetical protein
MRAEIEGHPKSDGVRHTVSCSSERNHLSAHGDNRRVCRHHGRIHNLLSLGRLMSQWMKTTRPSGHSKSSKSDSLFQALRRIGDVLCRR